MNKEEFMNQKANEMTSIELKRAMDYKKKEETAKDWRDAFIEFYANLHNYNKNEYSSANCLKITYCGCCTDYRILMEYVLLFKQGGFWFDGQGLNFITKGVGSDPLATYEHAKNFLKNKSKDG